METLIHLVATVSGAGFGAYCAYRLAERRITGKEREDYLALLLLVHEYLHGLKRYLGNHEEIEGHVVYRRPFLVPMITIEQIQRLMIVCPDKQVPRTLIHIMDYCRNIEKGMAGGGDFSMPRETYESIDKALRFETASLLVQYEQARGNSVKFPKLEGVDIS